MRNEKSSNKSKCDTITIVSKGDVLFTVSLKETCLYTSSSSIDWTLDSREIHHVTPCKNNYVTYETSDNGRVRSGNNHFCNIVGTRDV